MPTAHRSGFFKGELRRLDAGRNPSDRAAWVALVTVALSKVPKHLREQAADETTQDLLESVLRLRVARAAKWFALMDLPEERLRRRLKRLARFLYQEKDERRDERHALSQMVRTVLAEPLPASPSWPSSLRFKGRLSRSRVANAVAIVLESGDLPSREPSWITAELLSSKAGQGAPAEPELDEFTRIRRDIEGRRIAERMTGSLSEEEIDVLTVFHFTRSYADVARQLRCPQATARDRVIRVFRKLRQIADSPVVIDRDTYYDSRLYRTSQGTVMRALEIFYVLRNG